MDPTAQFFSKLKKLAVTLESESDKLQQTFENRNADDDSENTAKAMRAYHELNGEVGSLKGQVQDQLAQQKARESEVSGFIDACRVMQQKVTKDIHTLRGHWEKYGYRAPRDAQGPTKNKGQESENEDEAADENETKSEEEEGHEEAGDDSASSPVALPPPVIDALRTPQLSDFGLSEMQLKRTLAGAEWCAEVPLMPEMSLPHPALNTPAPPPMPLTPKCALRMSDDELLTPQMHDFGITEHTMCLNNDFTMDLLRKNIENPRRPSQDEPVPPAESLKECFFKTAAAAAADLESPEPPVFCTPGFKIKKTNSHRIGGGPLEPGSSDPESPGLPGHLHTTPEAPTFQTPYVNRLVSTKKAAQLQEPIDMQDDDDDDDSHALKLPTLAHNAATGSKRTWEYDVPEISFTSAEDKPMPEMPNLESVLGNSLQNRSAKMPKKTSAHDKVTKGPTVQSLELDGPTQEFSLGTPRIRMDYQEPTTPEMPDLSSITQDICKLVSQTQLKKTEVAIVQPNVRSKSNKNSSVSLSVVSEGEFQSLPSYLRQMTLSNLNQAVHSINQFTADFEGEKTELQMEELRRITKVGTKTPVFILCLTELKRLQHVRGARNTSVYKLSTR